MDKRISLLFNWCLSLLLSSKAVENHAAPIEGERKALRTNEVAEEAAEQQCGPCREQNVLEATEMTGRCGGARSQRSHALATESGDRTSGCFQWPGLLLPTTLPLP